MAGCHCPVTLILLRDQQQANLHSESASAVGFMLSSYEEPADLVRLLEQNLNHNTNGLRPYFPVNVV